MKIFKIKDVCLPIAMSLLIFVSFPSWNQVFAQGEEPAAPRPEIHKAQILEILEEDTLEVAGQEAQYQLLRVKIILHQEETKEITLEHGGLPTASFDHYQPGDQVYINFNQSLSTVNLDETVSNRQAVITTYARGNQLLLLLAFFVVLVLVVNGWYGVRSFLSLLLSFAVIFFLALPALLRGVEPTLVVILLASFIIFITFYLTHGIKKKTHVAVAATTIALVISSLLAHTLISSTGLTGRATEEAAFLSYEKQELLNLRGLLLVGIILGLLGTLDDITITQAGLVFTLKKNKKELGLKELYQEAMEIGQDHINSMVNTLVLVYTGASLPLLLLFIDNPLPFGYLISQEIVVEEIVRTLVSSAGLIMAAPLTTGLAALIANWDQVKGKLKVK